jgi:hypothetical protein
MLANAARWRAVERGSKGKGGEKGKGGTGKIGMCFNESFYHKKCLCQHLEWRKNRYPFSNWWQT